MKPAKIEHAPQITLDLPQIVGCTCGWRASANPRDSDTAYTWHLAIIRAAAKGATR